MQLIRRQYLFLLMLLGTLLPVAGTCVDAFDEPLPPVTVNKAKDLSEDARLSREQHKPILLFFSMDGCSWCEYVEEEHLKPMLRNANYRTKVIIRKVMTDDYSSVTDFNGKPVSVSSLALRYSASFTPTVIFLDHKGQQLAPRILGVRNTEMYGGDLDEGIKLSCQLIRQQNMALSQ